jgi:hydrogenase maturation protein HypF
MKTFQIKITGLVQGIGFRPFICSLANDFDLKGFVANTSNGVCIEVNTNELKLKDFISEIIHQAPLHSIIQTIKYSEIESKSFIGFEIISSIHQEEPNLLFTPDIAICEDCKQEILHAKNKRFSYAFTTCTKCGPRYSIIKDLPYDRIATSMDYLKMCENCYQEYSAINDRRFHSQSNSCPDCEVKMSLFSDKETCISQISSDILIRLNDELNKGKIIAVKGIGGYLLLCDANNKSAIQLLRKRKNRPAKPFALLYPNIESAKYDVNIQSFEEAELKSSVAPIVLCKIKQEETHLKTIQEIAPGLNKLGILLPYSPLLVLISSQFNKALIATSANLSGTPIIYKDEDALNHLFSFADYVLTYDREIINSQDDSVVQFTNSGRRIVLRRSRGLAPNYYPSPFEKSDENTIAFGAELKSTYAFQNKENLFVSQYLGAQGTLESKETFIYSLENLRSVLHYKPDTILIDKHPLYTISDLGIEVAENNLLKIEAIQHHEAHFAAVLTENKFTTNDEDCLGFIWDGTGFGNDEQIWGSEVFCLESHSIKRVYHLSYFSQLLGDKMSKDGRLSAMSILLKANQNVEHIKHLFIENEWKVFNKIFQMDNKLQSSSMGRFLDAISCLIGIGNFNTYESELAMLLEKHASENHTEIKDFYPFHLYENEIHYEEFTTCLLKDIQSQKSKEYMASKVFYSLVELIHQCAIQHNKHKLFFSGGVFQNAFLVELIEQKMSHQFELYFHKQLSPNDENISFGQFAHFKLFHEVNSIKEESSIYQTY